MANTDIAQRLSILLVAVAATAALLTEGVMLDRYLDGQALLSQFGFDVHYLVLIPAVVYSQAS